MKPTTRLVLTVATVSLLLSTIAAGGLTLTIGDTVDATETDDDPEAESSGGMSTTAGAETDPVTRETTDDDSEDDSEDDDEVE